MLFLILLKYALIIFATALIGAALAACVYVKLFIYNKYDALPGPKRKGFLFTNNDVFDQIKSKKKNIAAVFHELHEEYGPVVHVYAFLIPIVLIIDPAAIKDLLLNKENPKYPDAYRGFQYVFGQRAIGYGLLSETNTAKWEPHRRVLNPAFNRKYLMGLTAQFNRSADLLVELFNRDADGKTEVRLFDGLSRATLDAIAKAGFGMEEDMVLVKTPFNDAISKVLEGIQAVGTAAVWDWFDFSKAKFRQEVRDAAKFLRKMGEEIILKRLEQSKQGEEMPTDMISYIINAAMVEEGFNMEEMVDEFVTLFIAGQETTSASLSFALLLLGQHPEVMKKLVEEVDRQIGKKEDITYEDIGKLHYMGLVLKETLRVFPPVTGTTRLLAKDTTMCGYLVPKGTFVMALSYCACRSSLFYKDPLKFDPERFDRDEDRFLYTFFPFSLGPRSCIGQNFAQIEFKIILSKLLQNFSFKLVPNQDLGYIDFLTIRPAGGCTNYITRRS